MEPEVSRKGKNLEEEKNSMCEKKQEETTNQEEFDKLTRNFLPKLKKYRDEANKNMSNWKKKSNEEKMKDGVDDSLLEILDLTLSDLSNYMDDYYLCFGKSKLGVQLDQTAALEEIEKEAKFWEEFGELCQAERNAYREFIDKVINPNITACFRKLKTIKGVVDKIKNDPTLGDPWTLDESFDHMARTWENLYCTEGTFTKFIILRAVINFEKYYGKKDATAKCRGKKYEDLIKELLDLFKYDNWSDIFKLLTKFSAFGSAIGSQLRKLLVIMTVPGSLGRG